MASSTSSDADPLVATAHASSEADAKANESTGKASRKKYFVPLESNPEIMTKLLHKLGLSPGLQFHDVFSIDDPDLLAFIPRPAYALLLVFPVNVTFEKFRYEEDKDKSEYRGSGEGEEVVWYKQTIGNACGLFGLLHGVSNGPARAQIQPDSDLDKLIKKAIPLDPKGRAALVEETDELETAHQEAAATGDTAAPNAEDNVDLHYVCFVKSEKSGHLYEMDGSRKGPLDRGALTPDEDVLSTAALDKGVRAFLKREQQAGGGDLRFSLIALAESLD